MASTTIKKGLQIIRRYDNQLVDLNTAISIPYVEGTDMLIISVSRYGRSAGTVCTVNSLLSSSNGIVFPIGTNTITIVGDGVSAFTISSSASYPNLYLTVDEIVN